MAAPFYRQVVSSLALRDATQHTVDLDGAPDGLSDVFILIQNGTNQAVTVDLRFQASLLFTAISVASATTALVGPTGAAEGITIAPKTVLAGPFPGASRPLTLGYKAGSAPASGTLSISVWGKV